MVSYAFSRGMQIWAQTVLHAYIEHTAYISYMGQRHTWICTCYMDLYRHPTWICTCYMDLYIHATWISTYMLHGSVHACCMDLYMLHGSNMYPHDLTIHFVSDNCVPTYLFLLPAGAVRCRPDPLVQLEAD